MGRSPEMPKRHSSLRSQTSMRGAARRSAPGGPRLGRVSESVTAVVSACASSTNAMMESFNLIRMGKCDAVVTGGAECVIGEAGVGGFNAMKALSERNDDVIHYRSALGEAQILAGMNNESLTTFSRALELFPRNVPLTVRYAEALLRANQPRKAHEILLDLFNTVMPTPVQARLIAIAANSAGDVAESYYYMSEYHVLSGDLMLAINQLQLALGVPDLSPVQRARFTARLDQLKEYLPKREQRVAEREPSQNGDHRSEP